MFVIAAQMRPMNANEITFRRKALRDAVLCIAWLKIVSIICYVLLFLLVYMHSEDRMSTIIQAMLLAFIPLQVFHIVILFLGGINKNTRALELALWLSLFLAGYNTVLGITGGVYFIRTGHFTIHFLLAISFACLSLSLITVLCHDVILIYAYKRTLEHPNSQQEIVELHTRNQLPQIESKQ